MWPACRAIHFLLLIVPRLSYMLTLVLLLVMESHDYTISHMKHDVIDNAEVTGSVFIFVHTCIIYALWHCQYCFGTVNSLGTHISNGYV